MTSKAQLIEAKFRVKNDQFLPAWKALVAKHGITRDYLGAHRARTFVELLDVVGLEAKVSDNGNVIDVQWNSDRNTYHLDDFLADVAAYVHEGSYLTFHSEYGDTTTYRFIGGSLQVEVLEIRQEEEEEDDDGEKW